MSPEALAILASVCFAGSSIAVKKGAVDTSIFGGLLVSLGTGVVLTAIVYLLSGPHSIPPPAFLAFALAGVLGPAMGRATGMIGVGLLGPSTSVPLQGSLYPLVAIIFAVLFLDEELTMAQATGATVIIVGVWLLSKREPELIGADSLPVKVGRLTVPSVLFPFVAGVAFGTADIIRKNAITIAPEPVLGALIGTVTGFTIWVCASLALPQIRSRIRLGQGRWWFALSGFLASAAVLSVIAALERGKVSIVTPLVAAQPLPILILSAIFLRKIERLDLRIVVGVLSIVLGTALISLPR